MSYINCISGDKHKITLTLHSRCFSKKKVKFNINIQDDKKLQELMIELHDLIKKYEE